MPAGLHRFQWIENAFHGLPPTAITLLLIL